MKNTVSVRVGVRFRDGSAAWNRSTTLRGSLTHPSPAPGTEDGSGRVLWGGEHLGRAEEEEAGARALVHRSGDALAVWEGRGALGGGRARTPIHLEANRWGHGWLRRPRIPTQRPIATLTDGPVGGGTTPAATSSDASTRSPTTTVSAAARRCGRETWVKKYSRKKLGQKSYHEITSEESA